MHLTELSQFATLAATLLTYLCLLTEDQLTAALRDVRVSVPQAVRRGERATLKCYYDMEGDSLYSVKWYKGRREFYRYTPKETPAMKIFQFPGVRVERSVSNESQLVLESVNMATTGKYSCEVSADAPSFHTLISAGELEVVVPGKDPIISGIRSRYRVGEVIRGNCTSRHSKPAANLTWTINGYETNPSHIHHHKVPKDARDMETSISAIRFVVTPQHFIYGKLKMRCTAHIHDVYWKSTEKSIEEERHRHSGTGNNINLVNSFPEDYFDPDEDNVGDRSDTYMTHIKGDVSSLNSGSAAKSATIATRIATIIVLFHALQQFCRWLSQHQQHLNSRTETSNSNDGMNPNNSIKNYNNNKNNKSGNNSKSTRKNNTNNNNNDNNISHKATGYNFTPNNERRNKAIVKSKEQIEIKEQQNAVDVLQQHLLITIIIIKTKHNNANTNNTNNSDELCRRVGEVKDEWWWEWQRRWAKQQAVIQLQLQPRAASREQSQTKALILTPIKTTTTDIATIIPTTRITTTTAAMCKHVATTIIMPNSSSATLTKGYPLVSLLLQS